ncbi:MAG: YceI family protein [Myxococcales bacterium]|nr:YceI family protein [Myxococcales bacterium]
MHTLTDGTVHVFTYKEGLLSKVAHDLRLSCDRFEVQLDGEQVTARFWPGTLVVDGVMRDGRLDAGGLSASDKAKIRSNIQNEILHTGRHAEAQFVGSLSGGRLSGKLTMLGRTVEVSAPVQVDEGRARGRVTLTPTRWGITPYRALFGAIKLQDRVEVAFDFALPVQ